MTDSNQEPPNGVSSNQSSSDTVKEASQRTNREADGQKPKGANSLKRARILHEPIEVRKVVPSKLRLLCAECIG
jgi:hypothetical protein